MEEYVKDSEIPEKDASKEAVRKWRRAFSLVKNRRSRSRSRDRLQRIKEGLRVSLITARAAMRYMDKMVYYHLEEISSATNNFSDENLIMKVGLGNVYKGRFVHPWGPRDAVVQRFDHKYRQGDELQREISMLSRLEHGNIISVVGSCVEQDEKIIVYKQAFHGILKQHLSDPTLTWSKRLHICLGVAHALNHIHYDVIHCDINSSKIFLDEDWKPKIFGFELSTEYPQSVRHRLLFSHYFNTTCMTPKYDVRSFGELMLEVLYGRKPIIGKDAAKKSNYIIDQKQMNTKSLDIFLKMANECINKPLVERPTMDQIIKELDNLLELQLNHENHGHSTAVDEGISSNHSEMALFKIPLNEIREATEGFKEGYKIGSGGYGIVYKAKLNVLDTQSLSSMEGKGKDGPHKISQTVAIKRINERLDEQAKQGFFKEIELLSSCKHPNIVSLRGFSNEANEMILVYEYACNGSLSDYLESANKVNLTWVKRIQICLDIALGLRYLHTNKKEKPTIIHRDIKSDNILLDKDLRAKVADFGLSKFHATNGVRTIQTNVFVGTRYYSDPEFWTTGRYKKATDIYSFGVVLFEILSGRLAYDPTFTKENTEGLAPVARRRFTEGTLKELIDPTMIEDDDEHIFTLNTGPNQHSFEVFSKVAYQCLAETQARRPTVEDVINGLEDALKLQGETIILSKFRHSDIVLATENFSKTCRIELDAYGMLYKAKLDVDNRSLLATEGKNNSESSKTSIIVAIKRISNSKGGQGKQAFFSEIEMQTRYKHANIVSLLGFCYEGDDMILVYEHASNGSLDDCLKSANNIKNLTWTQRLHMCLGIANGLNHLHTKMNNLHSIIHGDIRSANILLGKNWEPKIAFFGVSKLHQTNQEEKSCITHNNIGTKVYLDPESEENGEMKIESDVYSFGVVLFEIFCGRLAYDPVYTVENDGGLATVARQCFTDGTIKNMIDPKLKEGTEEGILSSNRPPNQYSMDIVLKVACQCLKDAAKRPTLETVIKELEEALNFKALNILSSLHINLDH